MGCQIEDGSHVTLVFCIAEISTKTIERLLGRSDECVDLDSAKFRIMDTLDLDEITYGHEVSRLPPADFVSPFLGWTLEQVDDWYFENLAEKPRECFANNAFVVLDDATSKRLDCVRLEPTGVGQGDEKTTEHDVDSASEEDDDDDQETALLCSVSLKSLQTVRCSFYIVKMMAFDLGFMGRSLQDGPIGVFWRSGEPATKYAYDMVSSNGIYFEKGVPEVDEDWRTYARYWKKRLQDESRAALEEQRAETHD